MDTSALQSPEPALPQFRAVLRPYRSLSQTGFVVLMAFIAGVSFIAGMAFLMMGAWPVLGFFGLDVVLIYYAFQRNYADARACEVIEIRDGVMSVVETDRKGRLVNAMEYNSYWVRLHVHEAPDGSLDLHVVSHGRSAPIARMLDGFQKQSFAQALERALVAARGSPGI